MTTYISINSKNYRTFKNIDVKVSNIKKYDFDILEYCKIENSKILKILKLN